MVGNTTLGLIGESKGRYTRIDHYASTGFLIIAKCGVVMIFKLHYIVLAINDNSSREFC